MLKIKLFPCFLLFLSITCFSQVGIATSNPTATLDINGNLKIRTTSAVAISDADAVASLVVDNTTNEIKVVEEGNVATMNFIIYKLFKANRDRISNFNTNINASQYTLVVAGSSFNQLLRPDVGWYSSKNVYAFIEEGTWRLFADYYESHSRVNGDWEIYCLIINNRLLTTIPATTVDMGGNSTGAANSPAGL